MTSPSTAPRVAVITGVTSGIGEAICHKFIHAGFAVVGNGRNSEKLSSMQTTLGDRFAFVQGDAADKTVVDKLFTKARDVFGKEADLVVVNAGRGLGGTVTTSNLTEFDEVLKTNVAGALALMQAAGKNLAQSQKGQYPNKAADIVVIGSVAGRNNSPFSGTYGATKFAVHALTESLRREVGPQGVRVTLIEPGVVVSGFQKVAGYTDDLLKSFDEKFGPLLACEDVANAIYFAVSQPPHVCIGDIVLRPTRQDYP